MSGDEKIREGAFALLREAQTMVDCALQVADETDHRGKGVALLASSGYARGAIRLLRIAIGLIKETQREQG